MKNECSLWMGDIEPWMDEIFIMNSFSQCGFKVKRIKFLYEKDVSNPKRFCFVDFNNFQDANDALLKLNSKIIPNTNILFRLNLPKYISNSKNYKNYKNVYVGNLSPKITDIELFNIFKAKYPSVYYASIINDNGISRGYGFVHFSKEEEYKRCLKEMNGMFLDNRIIRVKEKINNEDKNKHIFKKYNYIQKKYFKEKIEEENCFIDKKKNNFEIMEKDTEKALSINSIDLEKKSFLRNIELLESDDIEVLYAKIIESVDNMFEYFKKFHNINEISNLIVYYTSNCKLCKK